MAAQQFEGIYIAYFTGALGSSMAVFDFKSGKLGGGDVGGGRYRGTYSVDEINMKVSCLVEFIMTPGNKSIAGAQFPQNNNAVQVPVILSLPITPDQIIKIETPLGPINAKFEKLQEF